MDVFKIAVVGDIHSNVLALRSCLDSISQYEKSDAPIDLVVFMGDLFTYGVRSGDTLAEIYKYINTQPSVLILGNHDQLYLDLISQSSLGYYQSLPWWIKESVDLNLKGFNPSLFSVLPFVPSFMIKNMLFSHANFSSLIDKVPNWRYVNSYQDHLDQSRIVSSNDCVLGVLGHTHRATCFSFTEKNFSGIFPSVRHSPLPELMIDISDFSCSIFNAGSIGQPRQKPLPDPSWLLLERYAPSRITATFKPFSYDLNTHFSDIKTSGLSGGCVQKLLSFFGS